MIYLLLLVLYALLLLLHGQMTIDNIDCLALDNLWHTYLCIINFYFSYMSHHSECIYPINTFLIFCDIKIYDLTFVKSTSIYMTYMICMYTHIYIHVHVYGRKYAKICILYISGC